MKVLRSTLVSRTLALSALALAAQFATAQLGPNLVFNGSFETPISNNNWGNSTAHNPATWFANQTFGGWQVIQGSIDIHRSGTTGMGNGNAYDGLQAVDLNGTPGIGGIAQNITINTVGVYMLQFAMSGNTGHNGNVAPSRPRTMRVRLSQGATDVFDQVFTWDPANHPTHAGHVNNNAWSYQIETANITINTPGTYTLSFVSTFTTNGYCGAVIDDVRLQLVPEPASMIALGTGLTSMLALRRRKTA